MLTPQRGLSPKQKLRACSFTSLLQWRLQTTAVCRHTADGGSQGMSVSRGSVSIESLPFDPLVVRQNQPFVTRGRDKQPHVPPADRARTIRTPLTPGTCLLPECYSRLSFQGWACALRPTHQSTLQSSAVTDREQSAPQSRRMTPGNSASSLQTVTLKGSQGSQLLPEWGGNNSLSSSSLSTTSS